MRRQILWITAIGILLITTLAQSDIVFRSERDHGNYEIYTMKNDGSGIKRLTNNQFYETSPVWAPDGKQIAISRDVKKGDFDIIIMNADGSMQRNLTNHPDQDMDPAWSPDGRQIAFTSDRGGKKDIYIIDINNRKVTQLTKNVRFVNSAKEPSWSPDGKFIAYARNVINESINIYIINVKTKETKPLTPPIDDVLRTQRSNPRWSPDGKNILFHELHFDFPINTQLVIVNKDGGNRRVLHIPEHWIIGFLAGWSSDGKQILFSAHDPQIKSKSNIYRYDIISREITKITNHISPDNEPQSQKLPYSINTIGKITTQWGELKQ